MASFVVLQRQCWANESTCLGSPMKRSNSASALSSSVLSFAPLPNASRSASSTSDGVCCETDETESVGVDALEGSLSISANSHALCAVRSDSVCAHVLRGRARGSSLWTLRYRGDADGSPMRSEVESAHCFDRGDVEWCSTLER